MPTQIPLIPDPDDARRALLEELAKREYQEAKPNWFDQLASAIWDWLQSLTVPANGGGNALTIIIVVLLIVVIALAILFFGVPKLRHKAAKTPAAVFEDDTRTARELRQAAQAAATSGDWELAVLERFRALARALHERTIVNLVRGATARTISLEAGTAMPGFSTELEWAATAFDAARYLNLGADEPAYTRLSQLDESLEAARPTLQSVGTS